MPVAGVHSARLPAAGVPWFMTIFGRDTVITCLQTLLLGPDLARTALHALAEIQASADDPTIDAEPGKIVHELRRGRAADNWFPRYYGSVDATPLFLILLSEVWRWTGDDGLVESLRPAALAALAWIDDRADLDGDGFVEFARRAPGGLEVQSWKDSWDSQRFADGRVATPPIAAAEVQGYVFDAKTRLAEIALVVWRDRDLAARLEHEAAVLSQRFDRAFWVERRRLLRARSRRRQAQVDSHCSNMGQLLWSGIVPSHRVDAVADQLFADGLWSGWGVRTMSRHDAGYGPLSYHNGTVWPHDNSLIAWGLARYGRHGEARRIARALLDASGEFGYALPEVFTGLARATTPFPVPYPTASRPQAWAAGTPVLAGAAHARARARPRTGRARQPVQRPAPGLARGNDAAGRPGIRNGMGRRRGGRVGAGSLRPCTGFAEARRGGDEGHERTLVAADECTGREALDDRRAAFACVEPSGSMDRVRQLVVGVDDETGTSRLDDLGDGSAARRDDRDATRHGLDHREAEGLFPLERRHERQRAREEGVPAVRVDLAEIDGVVAEERLDMLGEVLPLVRSLHLAGEADRQARSARGNDRPIGALLVAHPSEPGDVVRAESSGTNT